MTETGKRLPLQPLPLPAFPHRPPSAIASPRQTGMTPPMHHTASPHRPRRLFAPLAAALLGLAAAPGLAADEEVAPKGAAVTVLKAAKACFNNIVEVSGIADRARGDLGPLRAAGPESGGNPGRCRRQRHRRAVAGPAHAARGRADHGRSAGGRDGVDVLGGGGRCRLGQGRGAVHHHRAQRIRPDRAGAGAGYFEAEGRPDRAGQGDRRRRIRRARCAGSPRPSSPTASSARSRSG